MLHIVAKKFGLVILQIMFQKCLDTSDACLLFYAASVILHYFMIPHLYPPCNNHSSHLIGMVGS